MSPTVRSRAAGRTTIAWSRWDAMIVKPCVSAAKAGRNGFGCIPSWPAAGRSFQIVYNVAAITHASHHEDQRKDTTGSLCSIDQQWRHTARTGTGECRPTSSATRSTPTITIMTEDDGERSILPLTDVSIGFNAAFVLHNSQTVDVIRVFGDWPFGSARPVQSV